MPILPCAWRRFRALLGRGEDTGKAERQRIAADLHDGPLQSVIALEMRLAAARLLAERDPEAALKELAELADLAGAVVAELRAFQRTLSPPPLELTDLGALARRLVEDFARNPGIEARFEPPDILVTAPPETCLEMVQILREALANVRKHARAGRVQVRLTKVGEAAELIIEDDGVGFPFSGTFPLEELDRQGLGPASIRQRVRALAGGMTLTSRPGQGSRLLLRIPL